MASQQPSWMGGWGSVLFLVSGSAQETGTVSASLAFRPPGGATSIHFVSVEEQQCISMGTEAHLFSDGHLFLKWSQFGCCFVRNVILNPSHSAYFIGVLLNDRL
jgi:hypothetical protein